MKQKVLIFSVLLIVLTIPQSVLAYDFSAIAPTGQTLYYSINGTEVSVTFPGSEWSPYDGYDQPTGNLIIPSTVTDGNDTYSVTSIGNVAFQFCRGLTSVSIPNSVTSIGNYAFNNCSSLTSVAIPNFVSSIGNYAFSGCSGITSINIPNSVTSIGESSFAYCYGLSSLTIGSSVTSVGTDAFVYCTGLTSITVESSNTVYDSRENCNALNETSTNTLIVGCMNTVIPNSITTIGDYAFYGRSGLTSVTIPNSVTSIGNYAFCGCSNLTSVTIPITVTSIGDYAFTNCRGLTSMAIPSSVSLIGNDAFRTVRHIEYHGTASGAPWGAISMNGTIDGDFVFTSNLKDTLLAYIGGGGDVSIPNTVTSISSKAFYRLDGLISVIIPNSVTSIGDSVFEVCSNLTSISIPNSVFFIGSFAFLGCSSLTSITIPNSVTSIGDYTFNGCSSLTSVIIPNSVTSIGNGAFSRCSSLTSLTIPKSVSIIGYNAFYGCNGLSEITSLRSTAPTIDFDAFYDVTNTIPVNIPCGSTASYQSTWSYFSNFNEIFPHTLNVQCDNETMGIASITTAPDCSADAIIEATPNTGYNFVRWSDNNTDNPRTLTVTSDTTITAIFEAIPSLFNVMVYNAMGGGVYEPSSTAVVFALPQVDLQFAGWSDGEMANPRYIVVTSDTTLTALYRAPDTVRIYDTVINMVYDTTEYNHYYYDTTHIYDTLVVFDTTRVFDTLIVFDTTRIFDTMVYVNIDTLHHYYFDTTRTFDTMVYVNIDTLHHYYFDTTRVLDTMVYINIDTLHHYYFDTMSVTHYVFDSTWVFDSVWVFDSIYLSDTVFIFDTVYIEVPVQGIDGVETVNVKVFTNHTQIIVEGAQDFTVRLYDATGRLLATSYDNRSPKYFYVQSSGTYLVKIGDHIAKRVVVIR